MKKWMLLLIAVLFIASGLMSCETPPPAPPTPIAPAPEPTPEPAPTPAPAPSSALSWASTFGGGDDDEAHSVQQTSDGGYIVASTTESYGKGFYSAYLVKTDGLGNEQWYRTFGGGRGSRAYAHSVQQTSDGGYIIAGYIENWGYNGDAYLVKTDAEGN